jgi:PII-like signaling protein
MEIPGEAVRLRIHIGSNDTYAGRPLVDAILDEARQRGLAGATAIRGIAGFGASSHIHRIDLMLSHDLPILVEAVDAQDRIDAFLPILQEMIGTGLITMEPVRVMRYGATRNGQAFSSC